jgi:glutathionyl-hydroquinone reductase
MKKQVKNIKTFIKKTYRAINKKRTSFNFKHLKKHYPISKIKINYYNNLRLIQKNKPKK